MVLSSTACGTKTGTSIKPPLFQVTMMKFKLATLGDTYQPKRLDPSKMANFTSGGSNKETSRVLDEDKQETLIAKKIQNANSQETQYNNKFSRGNEYVGFGFDTAKSNFVPDQVDLKEKNNVEKPKLELIEDEGNLDLLFKQIRRQKGDIEEEKASIKEPTVNRVNIPSAFKGSKTSSVTPTPKKSVSQRNFLLGYDNVNLYNSDPYEQQKVTSGENSRVDASLLQGNIISPKPRQDIQPKRVSFHSSVYDDNQCEPETAHMSSHRYAKTNKEQFTHEQNEDLQNRTTNQVSWNMSQDLNSLQPTNREMDESQSNLNKLLGKDGVPAVYHKLPRNQAIDLNNLVSNDNDLNLINKGKDNEISHLHPNRLTRYSESVCNRQENPFGQEKTISNWKHSGQVRTDGIQGKYLTNEHSSLSKQRNTDEHLSASSKRFVRGKFDRPYEDVGNYEASTIQEVASSKTSLSLDFDFTVAQDYENRNTQKSLSIESLNDLPNFQNHAKGSSSYNNTLHQQQNISTKLKSTPRDYIYFDEKKQEDKSPENVHLKQSRKLNRPLSFPNDVIKFNLVSSAPKDQILEMNNLEQSNSSSFSSSDLTSLSSSLKETRAIFEQKNATKGVEKGETIRKVGKLNIQQGPTVRSSHAIKDRQGAAPSNMPTKMKQQLEDVLQGRSSTHSTPFDSRKGSIQDLTSLQTPSDTHEDTSSRIVQPNGSTLADRINVDASNFQRQYQRSDSGTSEGSSRDSIKQELEVLFGGRSQSERPNYSQKVTQNNAKQGTQMVISSQLSEFDNQSSVKSSPRSDTSFSDDLQRDPLLTRGNNRAKLSQDLKAMFQEKPTSEHTIDSNNDKHLFQRGVNNFRKENKVTHESIDSQLKLANGSLYHNQYRDPTTIEDSRISKFDGEEEQETKVIEHNTSAEMNKKVSSESATDINQNDNWNPGSIKKLKLPGLFLSSETNNQPLRKSNVMVKDNQQSPKVMKAPWQAANTRSPRNENIYNSMTQAVSESIEYSSPKSEEIVKETNKVNTIDTEETLSPILLNDNENSIDNVSSQGSRKEVIVEAPPEGLKSVGKLNMGNFGMFRGQSFNSNQAKPPTKKPSKVINGANQQFENKLFTRDEKPLHQTSEYPSHTAVNVVHEPSQQSSSTMLSNTSNAKETTTSETWEDFGIKDHQNENLQINHSLEQRVNATTIPTMSPRPENTSSQDIVSSVSPVSNIRRGKVMIPGAFVASANDVQAGKQRGVSQSYKQGRQIFPKSKGIEESTTSPSTKISTDLNQFKTENAIEPLNSTAYPTSPGPSTILSDTTEKTTMANEVNTQVGDRDKSVTDFLSKPKRLAIPNVFSDPSSRLPKQQNKEITPTWNKNKIVVHENKLDQTNNIVRENEPDNNDIDITSRKVGRLSIPGMFGAPKNSPGTGKFPAKSPTTVNQKQVIIERPLLQKESEVTTVDTFDQQENLNLAAVNSFDLSDTSFIETSSVKGNDTLASGIGLEGDLGEESSKDEDKSDFISPRRGNFNRNRFIGKISVPNVFQ